MNFFNQGIPLGRWMGIRVLIHWTFFLYAADELFAGNQTEFLAYRALTMAILFGVVLLHEFGHALSCRAVGGNAEQIILWPLGGIAFVQPPMNPTAWLITTLCGPLVNGILWPAFYFISRAAIIHAYGAFAWETVLHEFDQHGGFVIFTDMSLPIQLCLYMWQINKVLLLFNLIPAYPMDGGRVLQEVLWYIIGYGRSLKVAGMVGTAAGAGFVVIGLGIQGIEIPQLGFTLGEKGVVSPMLCIIGILCAMSSFSIYRRSEEMKSWRKN